MPSNSSPLPTGQSCSSAASWANGAATHATHAAKRSLLALLGATWHPVRWRRGCPTRLQQHSFKRRQKTPIWVPASLPSAPLTGARHAHKQRASRGKQARCGCAYSSRKQLLGASRIKACAKPSQQHSAAQLKGKCLAAGSCGRAGASRQWEKGSVRAGTTFFTD